MPATSTVYKSQGLCTDMTLPIQFKDPAATPGTKAVFDALDTNSWARQAAPQAGDAWVNLVAGGDCSFSAALPGWDGGFVFDGAAAQIITGPTGLKMAADDTKGFYFGCWAKFATVAAGNQHVASLGDGAVATSQFMIYRTGAILVLAANGGAGQQFNGLQAGVPYHMAVGFQGDGTGKFVRSTWLNGAQLGAGALTAEAIVQPAATRPTFGRNPNIGNFAGEFNRWMYDALSSGATVAQLVAADYAAGAGRFG